MPAIRSLTPLLLVLAPLLTGAGSFADIEVYDKTARLALPVHEHEGRLYLVGEPHHQYEVRIHSRSDARMLAVTSIDGVNVISGKTAAGHQSGYVLEAWSSVSIDGWRKSLDEVATFHFTHLPDSYAARTGRPHNVGVIGVALFREQETCCRYSLSEAREAASASAPVAGPEHSASTSGRMPQRSDLKLGTGHGHRESSPAQHVDFRRASNSPDERLVIYYDSRNNLLAQGVLPEGPRYAQQRPDPFPEGFAPDP